MLVRSAQPPPRDLPLSPAPCEAASSWTTSSPSDLRKVLVGDAEHMTVDELFEFLDSDSKKWHPPERPSSELRTHYSSRGSTTSLRTSRSRHSLTVISDSSSVSGDSPLNEGIHQPIDITIRDLNSLGASDDEDEVQPSPEEENKENIYNASPVASPSEFRVALEPPLQPSRHSAFRDITERFVSPAMAHRQRFFQQHRRKIENSTLANADNFNSARLIR